MVPPVVEPFEVWIERLRVDVVQDEYGYEDGELAIDPDAWRPMWLEGLTASEAFVRALIAARSPASTGASTNPPADAREALQAAWDSVPSLPPIIFLDGEADALIAALDRPKP